MTGKDEKEREVVCVDCAVARRKRYHPVSECKRIGKRPGFAGRWLCIEHAEKALAAKRLKQTLAKVHAETKVRK